LQKYGIIGLVVVIFLAFLCTYTVRFTEQAVVTTLGKADEDSVKKQPGLYWKVPYFQQVTKYDTRQRFLESNQETQQTKDDNSIIVTSFLTWRVDDPLKFFRLFSGRGESSRDHFREAEAVLKSKLRSAMGQVSRYRLSDLLSADEKGSQLAALEADMLAALQTKQGGEAALSEYGIVPVSVGVSAVKLTQDNTKNVFERMKKNRERIANATIDQGTSQAETIKSKAESDAKRITAFAERLAQDIRSQGDNEAAAFIKQMNTEPGLAVFLREMDFIRNGLGRETTLVIPTSMPGFNMLRFDATANLKPGQIPGIGGGNVALPKVEQLREKFENAAAGEGGTK
jgi:modulator of FtsH protease HflC